MTTPLDPVHATRRRLIGSAGVAGSLALAGMGGVRLGSAEEATPSAVATPGPTPGAMTSPLASPVAGSVPPIVRAWADAQNAMDPAAHAGLYAADATLEDVPNGSAVTGEGILPFLQAVVGKLANVRVELTSAFATETNAAAEYVFTATNAGLIPVPEAVGKTYSVRTVTYFELAGGAIRRSADYYDLSAVLRQLGLAAGPGE